MMSVIRNPFAMLIVLSLLTGCSGKNEKEKQSDDKAPPKDPDKLAAGKAQFTLTARQWSEEFHKDPETTDRKYHNKIVEMTGEVAFAGQGVLNLDVGSGYRDSVRCETIDLVPWKKASPGQTVKLRGTGAHDVAALVECEIIEVTGSVRALTVNQLVQEFLAAKEVTGKKYDGQYMILTGDIAKVHNEEFGKRNVWFKTAIAELDLGIQFSREHEAVIFKTGQQLKALGMFEKPTSNNKRLLLINGRPLN